MDKGAWLATVDGIARVGHDLASKPPPPAYIKKKKRKSYPIAGGQHEAPERVEALQLDQLGFEC